MAKHRPSRAKRATLLGLAALATLLFASLTVWQVERRAWKLALIAAVAERVRAAPTAPPPPSRWAMVARASDEYRHVVVVGRLLNDRETFVQALTEAGPGYWVMTPLRTATGVTILVNRGFVPETRSRQALPAGLVRITGLLRLSEPGGRFLRGNRPDADRWYSRDVAAIAKRRGVGPVAPYFVDADARPNPGGWPLGGLTVIAFPNNHLVYALTWLALAGLSAAGFALVWRERP
jgi:surfeit locus 1 family protein